MKKNQIILLLVLVVNVSCANENILNRELGLNIELEREVYYGFDKRSKGEISFFIKSYKKIDYEKTLYKKDYPKRPSLPKGWKTVKWIKAPFSNIDDRLDIVSNYNYSVEETKNRVLNMLSILKKDNNLHSYSYHLENGVIVGLQLFVLDIENSKFYEYEFFN
jgi:hypothetical protein